MGAFSQMIVASLASRRDIVPDVDLVRLYGSVWDTFFTLFAAITGGADWRQLLIPLDQFTWWHRFAFSVIITFMKFGVMNIVAAVLFVYVLRHRDTLLERETFVNQARTQEALEELREIFRTSKKEHQGRVTTKSCWQVLEGRGAQHLKTLGLSAAKAMGLFRFLEQDAHHRKDVNELFFLLAHSDGDHVLLLAAMMRCESNRVLHRIDRVRKLSENRFAQVLQEDPAVLAGRILTPLG